jgi:hypothetical protein
LCTILKFKPIPTALQWFWRSATRNKPEDQRFCKLHACSAFLTVVISHCGFTAMDWFSVHHSFCQIWKRWSAYLEADGTTILSKETQAPEQPAPHSDDYDKEITHYERQTIRRFDGVIAKAHDRHCRNRIPAPNSKFKLCATNGILHP